MAACLVIKYLFACSVYFQRGTNVDREHPLEDLDCVALGGKRREKNTHTTMYDSVSTKLALSGSGGQATECL